jgi:ABC-type Zn uptake system ZnuABC Zn-binding protein ZnuA
MIFSKITPPMLARAAAILLALALLAGCGEDDGGAAAGGGVKVVATTTQAADLARNVGGDRVEVVGLLAPNSDPHEYEVRPRDMQALVDADLVVRSGGDLDDWLREAIEGSGSEAPVLTLSDGVRTTDDDPHWWQDPRNAILAAGEIERSLSEADPAGAADYAAKADRYETRLRRLDRAVAACIAEVPPAQRKLVTTHDALGYYAKRYGIEVIGAVIPSLSTSGQPSAGETAELIRTIRDEDVKAIFAESSVNAKVEEAIAREAGATVGKALWADTLGPPGSDGATYVESIASNTRALVDGLTGGEQTCAIDD